MASDLTIRTRPRPLLPHVRSPGARVRAGSSEPRDDVPPSELVRLVTRRLRANAREATNRLTER